MAQCAKIRRKRQIKWSQIICFISVLQNDSEAEGVEGSEPPLPSQLKLRGQAQAKADPLQSCQCQCLAVSSQCTVPSQYIDNQYFWMKAPSTANLETILSSDMTTQSERVTTILFVFKISVENSSKYLMQTCYHQIVLL